MRPICRVVSEIYTGLSTSQPYLDQTSVRERYVHTRKLEKRWRCSRSSSSLLVLVNLGPVVLHLRSTGDQRNELGKGRLESCYIVIDLEKDIGLRLLG